MHAAAKAHWSWPSVSGLSDLVSMSVESKSALLGVAPISRRYSRSLLSLRLSRLSYSLSYCSLDLLVSAKQYISHTAANAFCANLVQCTVLPPRHQHFSAFISKFNPLTAEFL